MELPAGAAATIDRFLDACDQAVPDLVVPRIDLALDIRAGRVDEVKVADLRAASAFVRMLADAHPGEIGGVGTGPARGWDR